MHFKYFNYMVLIRSGLIIAVLSNLGFGKTPTLWGFRDVASGYDCLKVPQCISSDGLIVAGGSDIWQNGYKKNLRNLLGSGNAGVGVFQLMEVLL